MLSFQEKIFLKSKLSGLAILKNSNSIYKIDKIRKTFFDAQININKSKLIKFFFPDKISASKVLENTIKNIFITDQRQFYASLANQIASLFSKQIYKKKIAIPINSSIREAIIFDDPNIKFNNLMCDLLWYVKIFSNLLKGLILGIIFFFKNFQKKNLENRKYNKKIFFDFEENVDLLSKNINSSYFVSKFINNYDSKKDTLFVFEKDNNSIFNREIFFNYQDAYCKIQNSIYPKLNLFQNIIFLNFVFIGFVVNIFLLFTKNWYCAFLFIESVKAKLFRLANKEEIPDKFIIKYTKTLVRPLWSFEIEKINKTSHLLLYSLNSFGHKMRDFEAKDPSALYKLQYTHFIVWDDDHIKILNRIFQNKTNINYEKFGPIIINPSYNKIKLADDKVISVFDISPKRKSFEEITENTIIFPEYIIEFISNIVELSHDLNFKILYKPKRDIYNSNILHKFYKKKIIEILGNEKNIIQFTNRDCMMSIIKRSNAVISYPYTSTANIADFLKKPSVYYDPSNLLDNTDQYFLKGVPLIQEKNLLRKWLEEVFISK